MKTKEELNGIKEEFEKVNRELCELSEDELESVIGGASNFDMRFMRTVVLINAGVFGKSVKPNEVLTAKPSEGWERVIPDGKDLSVRDNGNYQIEYDIIPDNPNISNKPEMR